MNRLLDPGWVNNACARQFLTAVALSGVGIALRWAIGPWLGDRHEFLPAYAAVAAATCLGTWRTGLVVAAVSLAASQSSLFQPSELQRLSVHLQDLSFFVIVAGLLIYLVQHTSRRLRALTDEVVRLERSNHSTSGFLAMLAHELRNPLAAMSMGTDLVRSGRLDHRALTETWEMMERQTAHMNRLVADAERCAN